MNITSSEQIPLLLTVREAAKALSISERTLWSLTSRGELPAIRIGRAKRYSVDELHRWVEAQKKAGGA
jgi:excisionase family DNA binding protein